MKVNTELRRSNSIQRKQAHQLIEEKSDLETKLADREQQITKITDAIEKHEIKIQTEKSQASSEIAEVRQQNPLHEVVCIHCSLTVTEVCQLKRLHEVVCIQCLLTEVKQQNRLHEMVCIVLLLGNGKPLECFIRCIHHF